jgi:hypothetical protein
MQPAWTRRSGRAQRELFPKLQAAPGFVGFCLVSDEANGVNTAIVVWESKAAAEAPAGAPWLEALDELGHALQSENRAETVIQLEPVRRSPLDGPARAEEPA